MEVHVPDPGEAHSPRAAENFRLAIRLSLALVAILLLVHVVGAMLGVDPGALGVRPRTPAGLIGIAFAPLAHGDLGHLLANAPALAVLGTVTLTLYPQSARRVLPAVYLVPGIAVWLLAQEGTTHVGASGLVYGLASYVFVAGLLRRDRRAVAASMLVAFMYGALVWGLVPIRPRLSWETHLAAAIVGVALAFALRHLDPVRRKRYAWEDEAHDDAADAAGDEVPRDDDEPPPRLH